VAPNSDDSVNRQNYKTEYRLLRTALLTDVADDDEDAEQISAAVAERTGWKTGPASRSMTYG